MLPLGASAGVFWDAPVGVFGGFNSCEGSNSCWMLLFGACFLVSLLVCRNLPLGDSKVWQK